MAASIASSSDDDWLEQDALPASGGSDAIIAERDMQRVYSKMYNEGYSDGCVASNEAVMAARTEQGLRRGLEIGKLCGAIYASCKLKLQQRSSGSSSDDSTCNAVGIRDMSAKLRRLFFDNLPVALCDSPQLPRALVEELECLVRIIDPDAKTELLLELQELSNFL